MSVRPLRPGQTLDVFTREYCLCNAVIIFTQGRRRSEVETLPSCEHRNSDGDLRSAPAGGSPPNNSGIKPSLFFWSCLERKEIQAHHDCILSILLKSSVAEKAGVGRRAALATGSCKFFGEWKMSYGETYWPPTHPLTTPK
ncbi:hypothetical protein Q5P01_006767 [Channa striata]|uniref:Uncharacterized protein n=1 Tax=Channa striata TaxID=64152 RepID=A0AA88N8J8_CHASR|nr:hypothetical protein Q5P01_006767 [Channa striata]